MSSVGKVSAVKFSAAFHNDIAIMRIPANTEATFRDVSHSDVVRTNEPLLRLLASFCSYVRMCVSPVPAHVRKRKHLVRSVRAVLSRAATRTRAFKRTSGCARG